MSSEEEGARIVQTVATCRECPNRMYFSGGKYECTKTRTKLPESNAIPGWCPLPFYPVAHPTAVMPELSDDDIIEIRNSILPSQGESFDCVAFARAVLRAARE
jgi:hypothetical protein